ncbi:MAG TPA: peptidylprolyl isomerase [Blastocatellia bacterium]|nr:peptidylprolyl isomerase [Blastocatellia bacterium]
MDSPQRAQRKLFTILAIALLIMWCAVPALSQRRGATKEESLNVEELRNLQAVIDTTEGQIILEFYPDEAPNHVASFVKLAREGFYDGTTFFRLIKYAIIQGGDPLTKSAANKARYGTGGLNRLKAEFNDHKNVRGAVAAVRVPGQPNSAGTQFFIDVTDQPQLDKGTDRYTVFAHVVKGINVVTKISEAPVDDKQMATERIEIQKITIRPAEPVKEDADTTVTVASANFKYEPDPITLSDEELKHARAVIETSMGNITLEFYPDKAPLNVRHFLAYAKAGYYEGTAFQRILSNSLIQGGDPTYWSDDSPNRKRYWKNDTVKAEMEGSVFEPGTIGLAHGDDPNSGSIHFFITAARADQLDGKYTAFGHVVDGLDVVKKIAAVPVDGERPKERIDIKRITVTIPK